MNFESPIRDEEAGWARLIAASERLATARSLTAIVNVLRETARAVVGAEGIAVIIKDRDTCFYAAEDAVAPLWAGKRFPAGSCVSGWVMRRCRTIQIADVRLDERVPQEAYAPTFVRSLVMAPIGRPEPVAAIGAYWSEVGLHHTEVIRRLEALARAAAIAIENARLLNDVQESERHRAIALEAGRMGLWTLDVESGVLETSAECRLIFGRDPEQDFPYEALRDAIHPDDRNRIYAAIEHSLSTGADYDVEYRLQTPGGETRWVSIRAKPAYNEDGRPLSMSGVSIDITDRKQMEAEREVFAATLERRVEERTRELVQTQDALRQSQKLEAMGQLTGGVAHDFNNLLTPILGSLDLLTRKKTGDAREQRLIAGAFQSAERARILVQRLLAFARRQPLKTEAVDLPALLLEISPLIGTTLGPTIDLTLDLAANLPLAQADQNQLEMALLNLAVNARDAMPSGGRLDIAAHPRRILADEDGLTVGDYIILTVADTGIGMDQATRSRAIEPFFSTKGIGKGTGLGLSMVHGLVAQLGGNLAIRSAVGQGTVIELWLPVSQQAVIKSEATDAGRSRLEGRVLLVDDEPLVRATAADMLVELGLEVIECSSAPEALAVLARGEPIDLLVTDHLMPVMTGAELAEEALRLRPGLPLLLVSGYADLVDIPLRVPRLAKPFIKADLANSISLLMQTCRNAA